MPCEDSYYQLAMCILMLSSNLMDSLVQGGHGIKGFSFVFSLGAFRQEMISGPGGPSLFRDYFMNLLPISVVMFS